MEWRTTNWHDALELKGGRHKVGISLTCVSKVVQMVHTPTTARCRSRARSNETYFSEMFIVSYLQFLYVQSSKGIRYSSSSSAATQ
jgi:hypothetical protein